MMKDRSFDMSQSLMKSFQNEMNRIQTNMNKSFFLNYNQVFGKTSDESPVKGILIIMAKRIF